MIFIPVILISLDDRAFEGAENRGLAHRGRGLLLALINGFHLAVEMK
jgi:hypothetical protein